MLLLLLSIVTQSALETMCKVAQEINEKTRQMENRRRVEVSAKEGEESDPVGTATNWLTHHCIAWCHFFDQACRSCLSF